MSRRDVFANMLEKTLLLDIDRDRIFKSGAFERARNELSFTGKLPGLGISYFKWLISMLSYSSLRDIQKKEMSSAAITTLEQNFYIQVSEFLAKKKQEAFVSKSILAFKEYENVKKIALSIRSKREEKLVLIALRGENTIPGLTKEEKEMLEQIRELINHSRSSLDNLLNSDENNNIIGNAASSAFKKIRVLKDIQPYKGLDDLTYGPFKIGEEHDLPISEADWLLKSKLAEPL